MHVVAAYLMCILIFAKIGLHVGGHLGFLGPHHDSSQSPSIFLHLRYISNHLWNNFLWTSHAHRHPLRDCIKVDNSLKSICLPCRACMHNTTGKHRFFSEIVNQPKYKSAKRFIQKKGQNLLLPKIRALKYWRSFTDVVDN